MIRFGALFVVVVVCFSVCVSSWASPIALYNLDGQISLQEMPDVKSPEAAASALLSLSAKGSVVTFIPPMTKILSLDVLPNGAIINLSKEASQDLDDYKLERMFLQFFYTLSPFGLEEQVKILIDGREASSYLSPVPPAIYSAPTDEDTLNSKLETRNLKLQAVGLSGKRITLSSGHGWFWNGSGWHTQRGGNCGDEPEDYSNIRFGDYLQAMLQTDGAYVQPVREMNMNRPGSGPSGHPWWQEASYIWTRDQNYSCSVWASSSGDCSGVVGVSRGNDDVRARPLASNLDARGNTNIYIAIHTNAFTGDCAGTSCPSGTDGFYNNDAEHAAWANESITLAQKAQDSQIAAVQRVGFTGYGHHGSSGALYGNFGEIRVPQRPATLVELGFHDSCNTDAVKIRDPFFQAASAWGLYSGICSYFGNTPTYDVYASEYVSDTIPSSMAVNQSQTVEITFRNKSVLWDDAHGFRLGAVGDSDPFAEAQQAFAQGTVVQNNQTYTFSFTFTAPATSGTLTTDWRMVRIGYAWFGDTLTKQIEVVGPDTPIPPTYTPTATPTLPVLDTIIESRSGGQNFGNYAETGTFLDSATNCTAPGATGSIGQRYGSTYRSVAGAKAATFNLQIARAGQYNIYVAWGAAGNRRSPITYNVYDADGLFSHLVDQTATANEWVSLGQHRFNEGLGSYVQMTNQNIDASGSMYAGAVKLEFVEPPTPVPTDTPTYTLTPTQTSTFTPTDTPMSETPTVTPTDTPTDTPISETPTFTPTDTPMSETPTVTPTGTPTTLINETPTSTDTPTDTPTSETPTVTPTFTPTDVPTDTPTFTPTNTPTVVPGGVLGYIVLDIYGGVHLLGTASDLLPNPLDRRQYFPYFAGPILDDDGNIIGWDAWETAADVTFLPNLTTRKELSCHGIIYTVQKLAPTLNDWSISDFSDPSGKFVKIKSSGSGNGSYILDKFGYVYTLGDANPLLGGLVTDQELPGFKKGETAEISEQLRAVDLAVNQAEDTIYVLDSFGGVHIRGALAQERGALARIYFGWDIARDLEFFTANEMDCVLDGNGAVHPAGGGSLPPQFEGTMENTRKLPYWNWDIARDIEFSPDFQSAWVLDGFGPVHIAGHAQYIPGLWFGWDCAIDLEMYLGNQ